MVETYRCFQTLFVLLDIILNKRIGLQFQLSFSCRLLTLWSQFETLRMNSKRSKNLIRNLALLSRWCVILQWKFRQGPLYKTLQKFVEASFTVVQVSSYQLSGAYIILYKDRAILEGSFWHVIIFVSCSWSTPYFGGGIPDPNTLMIMISHLFLGFQFQLYTHIFTYVYFNIQWQGVFLLVESPFLLVKSPFRHFGCLNHNFCWLTPIRSPFFIVKIPLNYHFSRWRSPFSLPPRKVSNYVAGICDKFEKISRLDRAEDVTFILNTTCKSIFQAPYRWL